MQQQHLPNTVLLGSWIEHFARQKQVIMLEHYPLPDKETAFFLSLHHQEVVVLSAADEPLYRIWRRPHYCYDAKIRDES